MNLETTKCGRGAIPAALIVIVYLCLAGGESLTKCPWWDEGVFARPAYNLAFNGYLGDPDLDPIRRVHAPLPPGLGTHTFWMPPFYFLVLTGSFKVFGFSLFVARALSVFFGLILICSWCLVVESLTGRRAVALLTAALLAVEYNFAIYCASVRPDALTAALGSVGLAAYLRLRERKLSYAVLAGAIFAMLAVLTHPGGLIWLAALLVAAFLLDRRRFLMTHAVFAASPFVAGAVGCGLYILQAPSAFVAQFLTSVGYRSTGLMTPFAALVDEIGQRYIRNYIETGMTRGLSRLKILVLAAYAGSLAAVGLVGSARRLRGSKILLAVALLSVVLLGLLDNQKRPSYLVHVLPALASLCALAVWWLWSAARVPRLLVVVSVIGLMTLQVGGAARRIARDRYRNVYLPVVHFVQSKTTDSTVIFGPAQLIFGLPPRIRVVDDLTLGLRSGAKADLIVGDAFLSEVDPAQPASNARQLHVQRMLSKEFRLAFNLEDWCVYVPR